MVYKDYEDESRHSMHPSNLFHQSSTSPSERKLGSTYSSRTQSRRASKTPDTITVADFIKTPDCCVLCGYGIPSTRCKSCEYFGHNKCIQALFCNKVNLDNWRCPKCVTISNMYEKYEEGIGKEAMTMVEEESEAEELPPPILNLLECPFCKVDMDSKNCQCSACIQNAAKIVSNRDQQAIIQSLGYNKCLQYRDFDEKNAYQQLKEDDEHKAEQEKMEKEITRERPMVKIFWSLSWGVLFLTFAFPIAIVSALIFIMMNCMEACCQSIAPACDFFLKGVKLPGNCCKGVISGKPICAPKENIIYEKY